MKILIIKDLVVKRMIENVNSFKVENENEEKKDLILNVNGISEMIGGLKLAFLAVADSEEINEGDTLTESQKQGLTDETKLLRYEHRSEDDKLREENTILRRAIIVAGRKMIREDRLDLSEIQEMKAVFSEFQIGEEYKGGDIFRYNGDLFEVIQEHTSQLDWKPNEVGSLYKNHTVGNVIAEWIQPAGAHDAYKLNDAVLFENNVYISIVDNNVWKPKEYGWTKQL